MTAPGTAAGTAPGRTGAGGTGARARLAVVAALLLLAGMITAPARATVDASPPPSPVVVVGVPGLRWGDVTEEATPTLWRLVGAGAAGALSVRSAGSATCPTDGWLSLGAADRAEDPADPVSTACPPAPVVTSVPADTGGDRPPGARVAVMPDVVADNAELGYRARIGHLAERVREDGGCVAAIGPGAALGAADRSGRVDAYLAGVVGTDAEVAEFLAACPVTLVATPPNVVGADTALARVAALRPPSTLIVVGTGARPLDVPLADTLQVALEVGPAAEPGLALVSPSTRRPPYVQLIDVAPTVLARLGVSGGPTVAGQPWRDTGEHAPPAERVAGLVDVDRLAAEHRRLAVPAAAALAGAVLLALGAAALAARRRPAARRGLVAVGLTGGAVPAATYLATLVPWWRAPVPLAALLAAVAVAAVLIGALALAGPWRRAPLGPAGVVAAVTLLVLAADVVTGSRLQMSSVLGHSPLVAGRFSGFSNLAFGVLAAAALLTGAAVAAALRAGARAVQRTAVAAVVVLAVVVVGAPGWGSDVGGVLALVPAGVLLVLMATGARVSWGRLLVAALGGAAAVGVLAAADALRPPQDQSHLGRFATQVVQGEAWPVLARKASANLALVTDNAATAAVPVLVALLAVLVLRPARLRASALARAYDAVPELRAGLVAVLAAGVLGALANDSGVAVPASAFLVAAPLALAVVVRSTAAPTPAVAGLTAAGGPAGREPAVTLDPRGQAG